MKIHTKTVNKDACSSWDKQKRTALVVFWAIWISFTLLILFHKNELADPGVEFQKKICGFALLLLYIQKLNHDF